MISKDEEEKKESTVSNTLTQAKEDFIMISDYESPECKDYTHQQDYVNPFNPSTDNVADRDNVAKDIPCFERLVDARIDDTPGGLKSEAYHILETG
jgi:hypothetical protein